MSKFIFYELIYLSIYTNLPRLMFPNNSIHHSDILQARVKTTGITRTPLQWSSQVFEIVDTGGERAERKKWPHIFNVAHCVLFVVALNGYSKSLAEDIHAVGRELSSRPSAKC